MLLDLKNPKHRKILTMLLVSCLAYSISSILAYLVDTRMAISTTILSTQVGFVICTIGFLLFTKDKLNIRPSRSNLAVWAYGLGFALTGIFLFAAYKSNTLSNIFPLLEGSILVFLLLDLVFHRKTLSRKEIYLLVIGVIVVFAGTFFASSKGFQFSLSILPYAIGIITCSGIGYYALANSTGKVTEASKNLAFSICAIASGVVILALNHGSAVLEALKPVPFAAGVVSGFFLCIAFSMEIRAVKHSMTGSERKNVLLRNFINNFTELDTIVVLVASIVIGSYTYNGLAGGALIVIGVLILGSVT